MLFILLVAATLAGFILYPQKKDKKQYKNFYVRQKSCDAVLATATFVAVMMASFQANTATISFKPVNAAMSTIIPANNVGIVKPPVVKKIPVKNIRKKVKENIKSLRATYKSTSNGGKAALIILSVVIAALLLIAVITLACSLSCSGSVAGAILVGVGGSAVIIFLLIRVIRRINKGKRIRKEPISASV